MDIQKYQFYIILGLVCFGYCGIYFFFVKPYGAEIKRNITKLRSQRTLIQEYHGKKDKLPNDQMINYHNTQKKTLKENIQKAYEFFEQKDNVLEKWFKKIEEDLNSSGKKLPELYVFQPAYENEKKRLIKEYTEPSKEGLKLGSDSKSDEMEFGISKHKASESDEILPLASSKDIVTNSQMKKVQKQFFIIENLLKTLDNGKLKNLTKFKFLNDDWPEGGNRKFINRAIELAGEMKPEEIPFLIQEILNSPDFMIQITKVDIERDKTYKPETIVVFVPWGSTEEKSLAEFYKKNPKRGKLPMVSVTVRCEILDYQGS